MDFTIYHTVFIIRTNVSLFNTMYHIDVDVLLSFTALYFSYFYVNFSIVYFTTTPYSVIRLPLIHTHFSFVFFSSENQKFQLAFFLKLS